MKLTVLLSNPWFSTFFSLKNVPGCFRHIYWTVITNLVHWYKKTKLSDTIIHLTSFKLFDIWKMHIYWQCFIFRPSKFPTCREVYNCKLFDFNWLDFSYTQPCFIRRDTNVKVTYLTRAILMARKTPPLTKAFAFVPTPINAPSCIFSNLLVFFFFFQLIL